jgi:DNA integrity scanning protein DisA with diadenylate cyclase activity
MAKVQKKKQIKENKAGRGAEAKADRPKNNARPETAKWTGLVIRQAIQIAKKVEADAVLCYMDSTKDLDPFSRITIDARLILLSKRKACMERAAEKKINAVLLPDVKLTRVGYLKIGFLTALSKGLLKKGDVVVCVGGVPEQGYMDTIVLVEAGTESEFFGGGEGFTFPSGVPSDVFETLLDFVLELANEGREGKPVGSIFVLGDHKRALELSYQLVLNPFQGHPKESLSLFNADIQESLKEFSSIDGAFIIREDGAVVAAGRYLNVVYQGEPLPQGLGSRHSAAAAITQATDSLAMVISESTGRVTIFRNGRILSEIEKASSRDHSQKPVPFE